MGFVPEYAVVNRVNSLLMQCFGAQAMTCGLVLGTSQMTSKSFTIFAAAMIPYIVAFNGWFGLGPQRGLLTNWLWLDFAGNIFFLSGSLYCARLLKKPEGDVPNLEKKKP